MPYVNETTREKYAAVRAALEGSPVVAEGEMGYLLGLLLNQYFASQGSPVKYAHFARAAGVLDTVWFDFKARFLLPYENAKGEENGDVYTWQKETL